MLTITSEQALRLIKQHGQTLFGVKFIKENGELRSMSCKLHATQKAIEANKTGRRQTPNRNQYMIKVWDMNKVGENSKGAFRTINVRSLFELSIDGIFYKVEN